MCIDDETPVGETSYWQGCIALVGLIVVTAALTLGVVVGASWLM